MAQYLKENIAPILAKGIAECIEVQPQDPIEYLGLWMLHQQQKEELREKRKKQQEENERILKEWMETKGKLLEKAVERIQNVVRDFIHRQRKDKENEQRKVVVLEQIWKDLMSKASQDQKVIENDAKEQEEQLVEKERAMHEKMFEASKEFISKIEKDRITIIKKAFRPPACIPRIMKAVLLALGENPKDLRDWNMVKEKIGTPTGFMRKLIALDPESCLTKHTRFRRIQNIMTKWELETVKQQSTVAFLLFQWLSNLLSFRESLIQLKKAKKEDLDEEDDPNATLDYEDDEKDPPKEPGSEETSQEKPGSDNDDNQDDDE